jgi:putative transposase
MSDGRKLSEAHTQELLKERKAKKFPTHAPPPFWQLAGYYHISAACYEHKHIIGKSPTRMERFCIDLLDELEKITLDISAWCVLPNHYHSLVNIENLKSFMKELGKFHGRTSYNWNGEENCRGRKVWFNAGDRYIRSERHFWATMNYIHHNPVRHKYVKKWTEWPYSSVHEFLEEVGRERAAEIWHKYPLRDYGKGWDDPEL